MFLLGSSRQPLLRLRGTTVDAIASLEKPIPLAFATPDGHLVVSDGKSLYRLTGDAWSRIGRFAGDSRWKVLAQEGDTIWAADDTPKYGASKAPGVGVYKLEGIGAGAGGRGAPCGKYFVDLFAENPSDPPTYDPIPTHERSSTHFPRSTRSPSSNTSRATRRASASSSRAGSRVKRSSRSRRST